MKTYLVIGGDGQRYGPADVNMLVRWAQEGRLVGGSILIDAETNQQVPAINVPELRNALYAAPTQRPLDQTQTVYSPSAPATPATPRSPMPPPGGHGAPGVPFGGAPQPGIPQGGIPHLPPIPPVPTMGYGAVGMVGPKSKVAAGILGLLFGWAGAHRFYLGYPGIAILMICSTFLCGLGAIWGIIEGVLCLCGKMRDSEGRLLHD